MFNSFERFKQYAVQADSVEDFLQKYTKPGRHYGRGEDYAQCRIASYTQELQEKGFCFMSHHESVTGEVVSYYGQAAPRPEPPKLTDKQRKLFENGNVWGLCAKGRWKWYTAYDNEPVTREINALIKQGAVNVSYYSGGKAEVYPKQ